MEPTLRYSQRVANLIVWWLTNPKEVYGRWQGSPMIVASWLGLLLAAANPPHGTGVTVCLFRLYTGIPCPACGLTRSMSCALHGMFVESWNYHPFGLFILALFFTTAFVSLLPMPQRKNFARWMEMRPVWFNSAYFLFITFFLGFGIIRASIEIAHHLHVH